MIAMLRPSSLIEYKLARSSWLVISDTCVKTYFKHKPVEVLPRDFIDRFFRFEPVLCTESFWIQNLSTLRAGSRIYSYIFYLYFL